MKAWAPLSRDIKHFQYFQDRQVLQVLILVISSANYQDKPWQGIIIKKGQYVTSLGKIAELCDLSVRQVRLALEKLEKCGTIERETTNKYTVLTLCNYSDYNEQDEEKRQTKGNQRANESQTKGNQRATTIHDNNNTRIQESNTPLTPQGGTLSENSDLKKEGEGSNNPVEQPSPEGQKKKGSGQKRKGTGLPVEVFAAKAFPDLMRYDESAQDVLAWVKIRTAKGRTERAAELMRKKWEGYDLKTQLAVVRQSLENGWRGLFELKDQPGQKPGQSGQKPAYQTAQVNFKKEEDLIDLIKFYGDDQSKREYTLECRAKLYLVRKGKDSQDPNLLKSVKEAHETGKLNLDALDLNPTQTNA